MSKTYTDEQTEIAEKIKLLRAELDKTEEKTLQQICLLLLFANIQE